jgi:hypothetical protein
MKGIVFVELLAMAEDMLGEATVDSVIEAANLPSGGAYTGVGDYPCAELMTLIQGFSKTTSVPEDELQRVFGHWMMKTFEKFYPGFFKANGTALTMLESIENEVHVEVRKLYPNAELPNFDTVRENDLTLMMTYTSPRSLSPFCHGLIEGCLAHFDTTAEIEATDRSEPGLTRTDFHITVTKGA